MKDTTKTITSIGNTIIDYTLKALSALSDRYPNTSNDNKTNITRVTIAHIITVINTRSSYTNSSLYL